MTKKAENQDFPVVITMSERDFGSLTAISREYGQTPSEFILDLIQIEADIVSNEWEQTICLHRRLTASGKNGTYRCMSCGAEFEMGIPF